MNPIDREGVFKAVPRTWWIRKSENSQAIAISFDFEILAQWDGENWHDWQQYGQYQVYGDYYVIKKDGTVNTGTVEQLAQSLGWDGNLGSVNGPPPNVLVQVSVKADTYNDKTRYKAGWMNPGDFQPGPSGASEEQVGQLQNQFGSLLRAAAAGAAQKAQPVSAPERQAAAGPEGPEPPPVGDEHAPAVAGNGAAGGGGPHDDDLPF